MIGGHVVRGVATEVEQKESLRVTDQLCIFIVLAVTKTYTCDQTTENQTLMNECMEN